MADLLPPAIANAKDPTMPMPWSIIHRIGPVPIVFVFPLAPQFVHVDLPARLAIHQTVGDNFVDDFSGPRAVLARVQLRGTFGYHPKIGGIGLPMPGSLHLRTLELIYETFNALSRSLKADQDAVQEYINLGRLHYWKVAIERLAYRQVNNDPLLFFYEIQIARLQDYLSPVAPSIPTGTGLVGPAVTIGSAVLGQLF